MKKMNILQLYFIIHVFVIIVFSMRTLQPITGYDSVSRQSYPCCTCWHRLLVRSLARLQALWATTRTHL